MTALMQAVRGNDAHRVKTLIDAGTNVDELDANGDAALVIAAYEGYTEIVRMLLVAGADVGVVDPGMKATALHAAAYAGRAPAAKLLVEYGIDIDRQGPYNGYTALHDAVWQNNIEVARVLVDAGANLSLRSNNGETPLDMARARKRKEITGLLEARMSTEE